MMTNMFSMFDPSSILLSMNWIALISSISWVTPLWMTANKISMMMKSVESMMMTELKSTLKMFNVKINSLFILILLIPIMTMNVMGLIPYVFSPTSHMAINMSMSISMWMGIMLFMMTKNFKSSMAHILPNSTPVILMPMMILIETSSNLIRPMTLAIRLSANIIAGHLIMAMISEKANQEKSIILVLLMMNGLEIGVAMIQSYVFATLMSLYMGEITK